MKKIESYWKILKGEESLINAIVVVYDKTNSEAKEMLDSFDNDVYNIFYFSLCIKQICYCKLCNLNEINEKEIYHLNSPKEPRQMDIGFKGKETLIFQNNKWTSTTNKNPS